MTSANSNATEARVKEKKHIPYINRIKYITPLNPSSESKDFLKHS
jgi:hypothetical protein